MHRKVVFMRLLTLALGVALAFAGYFAERLNNERAATQARAAVQVELSRLRDRLDSTRSDAPLRQSPDAIYVDSTGLTTDAVVGRLLAYVQGNGAGASS